MLTLLNFHNSDEIRTGNYRHLFHPGQLINGTEDAANNFARGFYTAGRIIKNICQIRMRKEIEMTDRLQAIHIYRSLGGGTGSGMTATILEFLSEFAKITKVEIPIHPSPHLSSAVVEPYNCILAEHYCMDDIDLTMLMDNEALYDVVSDQISIPHPTIGNVNRIIAQICSSITSSSRYHNDLSNDFTIMTNLVPYPRIHYPLISYAPFGNSMKLDRDVNSVLEITRSVFRPSNQLVKCDSSSGKYMSCSLLYRGSINPTEVFEALTELKSSNAIHFVDWCPTGFKVGIVNQQPAILPESHVGVTPKNVIMMTNNSSVSTVWHRLSQKFHKLYSKRSFVHWFVSEGLEETEFCESLFNLATLAKDYEEVSLDTEVINEDDDKSSKNHISVSQSSQERKDIEIKKKNEALLKSSPRFEIPPNLSKTMDRIINSAEKYNEQSNLPELKDNNSGNLVELNLHPEEQKLVETLVTPDISEHSEANLASEKETETETEIKSQMETDSSTESELNFDEKEDKIIRREISKKDHEIVYNLMTPEENQNNNHGNKSENNFFNPFSSLSNNTTKFESKNDVRRFIKGLSFDRHGTQSSKPHNFDSFLGKCSINEHESNIETFSSAISRTLAQEDKCRSRFSLLNSKSKLNRRCSTSLDNFGNNIEEENMHSLMEELIRITAEITI